MASASCQSQVFEAHQMKTETAPSSICAASASPSCSSVISLLGSRAGPSDSVQAFRFP